MAQKRQLNIYLVSSSFYQEISDRQIKNTISILKKELSSSDLTINVIETEGSLEIPFIVNRVCKRKKPNGVIALGCIIKGKTNHYEIISNSVTNNLTQLSLEYDIPITSGVLTVTEKKQIKERTNGGLKERAVEAAKTLVKLINVSKNF